MRSLCNSNHFQNPFVFFFSLIQKKIHRIICFHNGIQEILDWIHYSNSGIPKNIFQQLKFSAIWLVMLGFQIIKHSWIIHNSETVLIQKFEESGLEMALHHHWLMMPTWSWNEKVRKSRFESEGSASRSWSGDAQHANPETDRVGDGYWILGQSSSCQDALQTGADEDPSPDHRN